MLWQRMSPFPLNHPCWMVYVLWTFENTCDLPFWTFYCMWSVLMRTYLHWRKTHTECGIRKAEIESSTVCLSRCRQWSSSPDPANAIVVVACKPTRPVYTLDMNSSKYYSYSYICTKTIRMCCSLCRIRAIVLIIFLLQTLCIHTTITKSLLEVSLMYMNATLH